jgi:hypothetical protein
MQSQAVSCHGRLQKVGRAIESHRTTSIGATFGAAFARTIGFWGFPTVA